MYTRKRRTSVRGSFVRIARRERERSVQSEILEELNFGRFLINKGRRIGDLLIGRRNLISVLACGLMNGDLLGRWRRSSATRRLSRNFTATLEKREREVEVREGKEKHERRQSKNTNRSDLPPGS